MKVYQLIKSLGRGGAEMLLPETLRVHDRAAFDFRYGYFLPHKGQVAEDLRELGATVDCFDAVNNAKILARVRTVAATVEDWGADVIHCHLPIAGVVGRIVGKMTGIPVVYTEHNTQERYHFLTRKLNLATLPWNRRIVACSDDVKRSIVEHTNLGDAGVLSLQNGVNTDRFSPQAIADLPVPEALRDIAGTKTIVGTVCVFRTQKRLHHWLELAANLYRRNPNLHFVIVGDGPEEENLRRQIDETGLSGACTLPGRLSEVRPWLRAMDVYLMTSAFEGLPIAMMEAMSMGLPVVATSAGGIAEAVRHGQDGYLRPVDDWKALEGDLQRLIDGPELRAATGARARQRIIDAFSIRRMTVKLEEVYRETAGQ
ncbi:glycosyltransferase [Lewinella sp. IMCC34183]|uniref:glycosyltransferase n=1 Tax=Lewinella sp. IMCC34183 TaxID=2248762 RepID=UPI000E25FCBF|nr:glycosyltransferase [Lewinella sp. IMCC34183]